MAKDNDDRIQRFLKRITSPYRHLEGPRADEDNAILGLARRINLSKPTVLVDVGCGAGRLLRALRLTRSDQELDKLTYIGVDDDEAAVTECSKTYDENGLSEIMHAFFLVRREFEAHYSYCPFLVDCVVMVFLLHELDGLNLDLTISQWWQRIRYGGALIIQDSSEYPHDEVEYLSFTPGQVEALIRPLRARTSISFAEAGKSGTRVFTLNAEKQEHDYSLPFLTNSYLETLHRSMLHDLRELEKYRKAVSVEKRIDTLALLRSMHRTSAKSRAYHQLIAFNQIRERAFSYCISCGGEIEIKVNPGNVKDPTNFEIKCIECEYKHVHVYDDSAGDAQAAASIVHTLDQLAGEWHWDSLRNAEYFLSDYLWKAYTNRIELFSFVCQEQVKRIPNLKDDTKAQILHLANLPLFERLEYFERVIPLPTDIGG